MQDTDKQHLRIKLKAWCGPHMPTLNAHHAAAMAERVGNILQQHDNIKTVAVYAALPHECATQPLINLLQVRYYRIVLPVVAAKDSKMAFRLYVPGAPMIKDQMGVAAPGLDQPEIVPDAVIVPLLGFNKDLYRLGRGGGYYDRTLETLANVLTIGLAFEGQLVDFTPEPHDCALDHIVTETGVLARNTL